MVVSGWLYLRSHYRFSRVQSTAMAPTIPPGSRVIWTPISSSEPALDRWSIVVLRPPGKEDIEVVKRVIGLPGESIEIREGTILIDGKAVNVPDSASALRVAEHRNRPVYEGAVRIPDECVFVIGDNTRSSMDSRDYGPVPRRAILGHVRSWTAPGE